MSMKIGEARQRIDIRKSQSKGSFNKIHLKKGEAKRSMRLWEAK